MLSVFSGSEEGDVVQAPSRRDRVRAATIEEIKGTARQLLVDEGIGLSAPVSDAVPEAVRLIEDLLRDGEPSVAQASTTEAST